MCRYCYGSCAVVNCNTFNGSFKKVMAPFSVAEFLAYYYSAYRCTFKVIARGKQAAVSYYSAFFQAYQVQRLAVFDIGFDALGFTLFEHDVPAAVGNAEDDDGVERAGAGLDPAEERVVRQADGDAVTDGQLDPGHVQGGAPTPVALGRSEVSSELQRSPP